MDYLIMAGATALGYSGAHWSVVLVPALLLTLVSSGKFIALTRNYADLGATRVLVKSVGAFTANNLAFAAMAFALGRAAAWLLSR